MQRRNLVVRLRFQVLRLSWLSFKVGVGKVLNAEHRVERCTEFAGRQRSSSYDDAFMKLEKGW